MHEQQFETENYLFCLENGKKIMEINNKTELRECCSFFCSVAEQKVSKVQVFKNHNPVILLASNGYC